MATYYVSFNLGSDVSGTGATGNPWKTPAKALTVVTSGDTVKFRGSKTSAATYYPTPWTIRVAGVTWTADTGHTPTWDGDYTPTMGNAASFGLGSSRPGGLYLAMLTIRAANTTVSGLRFQNVGGEGISAGEEATNVLIDDCETDTTFGSAITVRGSNMSNRISGAEISNCSFVNSSFGWFQSGGSDQSAGCGVMLRDSVDTHFHHNLVAYCCKEGIDVDKGSTGSIVEYNTLNTINHSAIYINRAVDCDVRYNVTYHTKNRNFLGAAYSKRTIPGGITIADEMSKNSISYPHGSQTRVYGNLVFGGFKVANNTTNYNTQLTEAYIGYNTFVGEVWTDPAGVSRTDIVCAVKENQQGRPHENSLFENNLIYAPATVKMSQITGSGGVTFRNNCWFSADGDQVETVARNATNITTNPQMVNPDVKFNDVFPALTGTGYNVNNYKLKDNSPCIGRASDRSRVNGVTPPTITTDLDGVARTDYDRPSLRFYDIGALENGVGGEVTDAVDANFTQGATSGVAPLEVWFTDTSTEEGDAEINAVLWNFGDGSTGNNPSSPFTHIYSQPGTFTPTLTVSDTVLNLSDSKTGSAITVTAPPTSDLPGVMDVVRAAMPTTATSKAIAFNLNGHAPALVLLWLTKATAVNSAVDGAMLSYGAAAPGGQWAFVLNSKDNQADSLTEKYGTTSACVLALADGVIVGSAGVTTNSFAADRLVLDVTTGFPAGYFLTAVAFGGAQFRGKVAEFFLGVQNTETTLTPGFTPELYMFGGNTVRNLDAVEDDADFIIGMTDGDNEYSFTWKDLDALATTKVKASIHTAGERCIRTTFSNAGATFSDYEAGKLVVLNGDLQRRFGYAALDVPASTSIVTQSFQTPIATGNQSYDFGIEAAGAILVVSGLTTVDAQDGASPRAEGFAIVAADAFATYGTAIASSQAAATSNTKSIVTNNIKVINGAGTTILEGALTFDADGFDINWTTVDGAALNCFAVAIGPTPSVTGPLPEFTADTVTPDDGVVQFTDLSNENGAEITDWYWTFGDGLESTEQHPEHTYADFGTYTVSLTVTNANGEETRTKVAYITFVQSVEWLQGPYRPRAVTNTTVNKLYGDDASNPYYGEMEIALDLDALEIDENPEDLDSSSAKPGKARLVIDRDNGRLKLIFRDGTSWIFEQD